MDVCRGEPDGFNVGIRIDTFCSTEEDVAKLLSAIAEIDNHLII